MSLMLKETLETQEVLRRQWDSNKHLREHLSKSFQEADISSYLTAARGSSNCAAQYLNYLISIKMNKLASSIPLSLISVHNKALDLSRSQVIALSQSGKSPDIIAPINLASSQGAQTISLVNKEQSPLAKASQFVYPLMASEELSVAATKSFIASLFASASLVSCLASDTKLRDNLERALDLIPQESSVDWSPLAQILLNSHRTMILGRGLGYPVAQEAALKLKETCHVQAEAFSSAEFMHGPQTIVAKDYPLVVFALRGKEQEELLQTALTMRERGAKVCIISDNYISDHDCQYIPSSTEELDPINAIFSFYIMVQQLAKKRGLNPDKPDFLKKETLTI